jgi:hypothetical protein
VQGSGILEPHVLDATPVGCGTGEKWNQHGVSADSSAAVVVVASSAPMGTCSSAARACHVRGYAGAICGPHAWHSFGVAGTNLHGYKGLRMDGICACMASAWLASFGTKWAAQFMKARPVLLMSLGQGYITSRQAHHYLGV